MRSTAFRLSGSDSHINQLQKLKLNLLKTQQTTQERLAVANNSVALQVEKQIGAKPDLSGAWLKMQALLLGREN
jgi:hypothetical protein